MKSFILFVLGMCTTPAAQKACTDQCATLASCADAYTMSACTDDCALHPSDPEIASCIARAGCAGYRKRLAMDLDLVGSCKATARRP